jgi:hypothetical protein
MAMEIWQDIFFKESNQSLIQTCLHLINEERNGRRLGSLLIRQVVQSYGIERVLDVYFENSILYFSQRWFY